MWLLEAARAGAAREYNDAMVIAKVPPKWVPWLVTIFCVLGLAGLVGLLTQNHIWPFK
jgi:hypothetical protein